MRQHQELAGRRQHVDAEEGDPVRREAREGDHLRGEEQEHADYDDLQAADVRQPGADGVDHPPLRLPNLRERPLLLHQRIERLVVAKEARLDMDEEDGGGGDGGEIGEQFRRVVDRMDMVEAADDDAPRRVPVEHVVRPDTDRVEQAEEQQIPVPLPVGEEIEIDPVRRA